MNDFNLNEKIKKDFLNYAGAVIKSRAISSVEDNLKPVHRRILYVMGEEKLWSNKKTVKSANVVGKTMMYHPHGDSSIYDAMVRLAQPWKMRYPLIDMQGNIGSILGDGAAAPRYTETRLSKLGEMMLEDISKDAIPYKPTYDDTNKEPVVLPSRFPNILCNGNAGIAVGLSASLVPHNLGEVVDGIIAYLDYKNIGINGLMKHIPAPDFPTGGTIVDGQKLTEIYNEGHGTITLRAKYRIEEHRNIQHIVFYEVPYLVSIEERIIKQIKDLVIEEGFDLIDDYSNETNSKGVLLRIILKKNANVYKVLDKLWKHTGLQVTQRVNNTVLIDGNPRTLNLKELIQLYVNHRHNVIINVANHDLQKLENRLLTVSALVAALQKIDEVIEIIKKSNNRTITKTELANFLNITEDQAGAVMDMKISRIGKMDVIELQEEYASLQEKKKELLDIIANPATRELQMKKELLNMKNVFNDERRTTVSNMAEVDSDLPSEPIKLIFFGNGNVFTTQQDFKSLGFNKKGTLMNQSPVKIYKETTTDATLHVFGKDGSVELVKMLTLGIDAMETLGAAEEPVAAFDFDKEEYKYLVFVTKNGLVKKTKIEEYLNLRSNTKAIKIKDGDELIAVIGANDDTYIYLLNEKLAKFAAKDINATGRLTIGSKGINGGAIGAVGATEEEKILTINSKGQGKLTFAKDYNITAKGANGQVITDNTILISSARSPQIFVYSDKKNHIIDINSISIKSKTAVGAKLVSGSLDSISN